MNYLSGHQRMHYFTFTEWILFKTKKLVQFRKNEIEIIGEIEVIVMGNTVIKKNTLIICSVTRHECTVQNYYFW